MSTNLNLNTKAVKQTKELAAQNETSMTATMERAVDEMYGRMFDCACNGSGIIGRFRSEFIYCRCRTGLDEEMNMIAKQLQILADDLVVLTDDAPGRAGKQFLFDQLKAEYDELEQEWTKLQVDRA